MDGWNAHSIPTEPRSSPIRQIKPSGLLLSLLVGLSLAFSPGQDPASFYESYYPRHLPDKLAGERIIKQLFERKKKKRENYADAVIPSVFDEMLE